MTNERRCADGPSAQPPLPFTSKQKTGCVQELPPRVRPPRTAIREGIAVRAGHHCAQPSMRRFGVQSTVRPSLAFYNTPAEVDQLVSAVRKIKTMYVVARIQGQPNLLQ